MMGVASRLEMVEGMLDCVLLVGLLVLIACESQMMLMACPTLQVYVWIVGGQCG